MAKAKLKQRPKAELAKTNSERPFAEVWRRADVMDAQPSDRAAFRERLEQQPDKWRNMGAVVRIAEKEIIEKVHATGATKELMALSCVEMRKELTLEGDGALELMLVDAAVLAWLRLGCIELSHTNNLAGSFTTDAGLFWDKRLSSAHKRFREACTSLARVRKLRRPKLNLTIAQINNLLQQSQGADEASPELCALFGAMAANGLRKAREASKANGAR